MREIKNLKNLELVEYNYYTTDSEYLDELDKLEVMTDEFLRWSKESHYISDSFWEIADNNTPIYYGEIWEEAGEIIDYIEDAIKELGGLLADNLFTTFQYGIGRDNELSLYGNVEELITNYTIVQLDVLFDNTTDEELRNRISNLELEDVNEIIDGIDETNKFSDIIESINKYLGILE